MLMLARTCALFHTLFSSFFLQLFRSFCVCFFSGNSTLIRCICLRKTITANQMKRAPVWCHLPFILFFLPYFFFLENISRIKLPVDSRNHIGFWVIQWHCSWNQKCLKETLNLNLIFTLLDWICMFIFSSTLSICATTTNLSSMTNPKWTVTYEFESWNVLSGQ